MISAGRMNERVGLLAPTEVRSPSGEASIAFSTAATVWASVEGMSSREILQAQQADVIATHRIFIRSRSDISHEYRISWRGKVLEVASITDRRGLTEILVREKV